MVVNMYTVVDKNNLNIYLLCSFKLKSKAEEHARILNISSDDEWIVVPSEINLFEPVNQLGVQ